MKVIRWTAEEDAIVRAFWHKQGALREHCHLLPHRSQKGIEKRGQNLGLGPRPRTWWTKQQDRALRAIWHSGKRIKDNMHLFGDHSYAAVITRADLLGLGRRAKCPRGQSPIAWKLMERALRDGPADRFRLADVVGIDAATSHKAINRAHDDGLVHIVDWIRPKTKLIPVYKLGPGKDVPRPPRETPAAKQRRYRARMVHSRVLRGEVVIGVNPFSTLIQQVAL